MWARLAVPVRSEPVVIEQTLLTGYGGFNQSQLPGFSARAAFWIENGGVFALPSLRVCAYPLLDMLRYHRFLVAGYWVPEYGSAEDAAQFSVLRAYSPYHHVKPGERYPAVLFITGDGDTRVAPLHARKMAALLQASNRLRPPGPPSLRHEGGALRGPAGEQGDRGPHERDALPVLAAGDEPRLGPDS